MITSFGPTVILYALALAVALVIVALGRRARPHILTAALLILEIAVIIVALLDVISLVSGDHGPDVVTNLGYAAAAVALLPFSAVAVRLDRGRWASIGLALGCAMVAVATLRLHQTLGPVDG